ncbi:hypothetical protein ACL7TT_17265 [Microbulbifer sp. 2304DJ12-6]
MPLNKNRFQTLMIDDDDNGDKDLYSNRGQKPDNEQKPPESDKPTPDKD